MKKASHINIFQLRGRWNVLFWHQVVRALDSLDEMSDLANGVKPGQSGVFDSAEHSAQIRMFQRMAFGSQDYSYGYSDRDRSRSYSQSQSSWSRESREQSPSAPMNRSRQWNIWYCFYFTFLADFGAGIKPPTIQFFVNLWSIFSHLKFSFVPVLLSANKVLQW